MFTCSPQRMRKRCRRRRSKKKQIIEIKANKLVEESVATFARHKRVLFGCGAIQKANEMESTHECQNE